MGFGDSQMQPMQLSLKPFGVGSHWYSEHKWDKLIVKKDKLFKIGNRSHWYSEDKCLNRLLKKINCLKIDNMITLIFWGWNFEIDIWIV